MEFPFPYEPPGRMDEIYSSVEQFFDLSYRELAFLIGHSIVNRNVHFVQLKKKTASTQFRYKAIALPGALESQIHTKTLVLSVIHDTKYQYQQHKHQY